MPNDFYQRTISFHTILSYIMKGVDILLITYHGFYFVFLTVHYVQLPHFLGSSQTTMGSKLLIICFYTIPSCIMKGVDINHNHLPWF